MARFALPTFVAVWSLAAVAVWGWTAHYGLATDQTTPTSVGEHWPPEADVVLAEDRPTLLFFVHPRCPCTRASVHELARVLTGRGLADSRLPRLTVVASVAPGPDGDTAAWRDTDLLASARSLPHADVAFDVAREEAARFGAVSSGAVALYATDGRRLFFGGVTSARGHEGDSAGSEALWRLLAGELEIAEPPTPVFGCRLRADGS